MQGIYFFASVDHGPTLPGQGCVLDGRALRSPLLCHKSLFAHLFVINPSLWQSPVMDVKESFFWGELLWYQLILGLVLIPPYFAQGKNFRISSFSVFDGLYLGSSS